MSKKIKTIEVRGKKYKYWYIIDDEDDYKLKFISIEDIEKKKKPTWTYMSRADKITPGRVRREILNCCYF